MTDRNYMQLKPKMCYTAADNVKILLQSLTDENMEVWAQTFEIAEMCCRIAGATTFPPAFCEYEWLDDIIKLSDSLDRIDSIEDCAPDRLHPILITQDQAHMMDMALHVLKGIIFETRMDRVKEELKASRGRDDA